jgi:hypothetical protein
VRRELRRFGPQGAIGELVRAWPAAVGAEIARNAWPARFRRNGTLVVHTRDSVWAFELTQRGCEIARRLDVKALKFVPGPLAEAAEEAAPAPSPGAPPPTREQLERAASWAAAIEDEELRKLVQAAAELSLSRAAADRPF